MAVRIDALLAPRSIALVGASSKPGKVGHQILQGLREFPGELYLVNPKESRIDDRDVVSSVEELPEGIDMAIIAIGARHAVEAARQAIDRGVKVIIPVAGGFSETGPEGRRLEAAMVEAARSRGARILGPNTLGIFIPGTGLDTIFVEHGDEMFARPGEVAFVTQSGSVGVEALGYAGSVGWGLRAFVGLGNRSDIAEQELVTSFAEDEATRCLAFYLETFDDGRAFLDKCRAVVPDKPVVILKAGRSAAAQAAVASHTGRLAGPSGVFFGAARQYGIHVAGNEEELVDYAKVLANEPPARKGTLAIVTPAGGFGVIALDVMESLDHLELATIAEATKARIQEAVPPFASLDNPLDLTASCTDDMMAHTLRALEEDDGVGIIMVMAFFAPPGITMGLIDILAEHRRRTKKPLIVFTVYGPYTNDIVKRLYDQRVMAFRSARRAMQSANVLAERGFFLAQHEARATHSSGEPE